MKILLTGRPRSGKTTLLQALIKDVPAKQGLVAAEVRKDGERIGFDLQDNQGRIAPLARIDTPTEHTVGRYSVDIASLDDFIDPLFAYQPDELLYIDEIGHMQLFSEKFRRLIKNYLDSDHDLIGTISYIYKYPFITEVRRRDDVLLCVATPENRDDLKESLHAALANREQFRQLSRKQQNGALQLAQQYLDDGNLTSLRKLFNNAVPYVSEKRVKKLNDTAYKVQGNHGTHTVLIDGLHYTCDCDLFNGRGQFTSAECSHIQAVKLASFS